MSGRPNTATTLYNEHLSTANMASNSLNNRTAILERMYIRILSELCINRFKWSGLPREIDLRFLELTLFRRALCVFYFDKRFDKFMALEGGSNGFINMLDNPTAFQVIGNNFVGKTVSALKETKDAGVAVPIWSNMIRVPDHDIILIYATQLAELHMTIEINSKNARRNKVIFSPESTRLSMANLDREIARGNNSIKASGAMQDMEFIKTLDLGIDAADIEKLHILKTRLWGECMGLLGIDFANQDKKERLITGEVDANQEQVTMMRHVNLNARRQACELIMEKYPQITNLSVEYHTVADQEEAEQEAAEPEGDRAESEKPSQGGEAREGRGE